MSALIDPLTEIANARARFARANAALKTAWADGTPGWQIEALRREVAVAFTELRHIEAGKPRPRTPYLGARR